jgi:hypothetical protein
VKDRSDDEQCPQQPFFSDSKFEPILPFDENDSEESDEAGPNGGTHDVDASWQIDPFAKRFVEDRTQRNWR